jgi:predicted AlkP superfamily phosphohydrolase/phosphomutase
VLRGTLLYGLLLGLLSLALHLPFTWNHPRRARRALPWGLTVALAVAAVLDGAHASYFAYFLPPGMNERLIKTALWLALGAIISFYTALLHTLHRRPYGRRSRSGYVLMTALSIFAMIERREAFQPRPALPPRPAAVETGQRPRLWVVGIETATLDAILPLADQGRLPFFSSLIRGGAYGRLDSLTPPSREALWTTLITGKYPYKHGVTGNLAYRSSFIAPGEDLHLLPDEIGFRRWGMLDLREYRLEGHDRRALALWDILARLGVPSGVLGWPVASPASRETVYTLPEPFFSGTPDAYPEETAEKARLFRVSPHDIEAADRARLGAAPPRPVLDALAGDLWRESLATFLQEQHADTGAVFVSLPGLRAVSRRSFGGYDAVQFAGSQNPGQRRAWEQVAGYYAQLDSFLAEVWRREPDPKILVVVSPYGARPRTSAWQKLTQRTVIEGSSAGSPDGILLFYGEGIRAGELITGARLVDLAPTLLYALGFPVARDLDGQVLTAAFDQDFLANHPLTFYPSYEALAAAGSPPAVP